MKIWDKEKEQQVDIDDETIRRAKNFFPASLPTTGVFKIACLNRKFKALIEEWFKPFTLKDFKMYHDFLKFATIFLKEPNFEKFEQDKYVKLMKSAYKNKVYGQSVF
jgi:hypothetical protein